MTEVLIVSGGGAYVDPWHPFDETTAQLRNIIGGQHTVTVTTDVADALRRIDAQTWGLIVLNFGSAGAEVDTDAVCVDGLERHLSAGGPLLASHVAATLFPADPRWEEILGGRWVRGTTMHPAQGEAVIEVTASDHPATGELADFSLWDERYSYLRTSSDVQVLATHRHDALDHPVVWTHRWRGARVAYDGLGHDARSYESPQHRELVRGLVEWLIADDARFA